VGISACRNIVEMDIKDFARETVLCEWEYYALSEGFRAQITLQQFISIKNPRWSKDEVTWWVNIAGETEPKQLDGGKHRLTLHPLGAGNVAIVARYLGNQIIDVGVKVTNALLRCTMTVRMRRCTGMQP
jgi:hypothetical protein